MIRMKSFNAALAEAKAKIITVTLFREFEPRQDYTGDLKDFLDIIKKSGLKPDYVEKPSSREANMTIGVTGPTATIHKMIANIKKNDDGLTSFDIE